MTGHQQLLLALPLAVGTALAGTSPLRWVIFSAYLVGVIAYQAWAARAFFGLGALSSVLRSFAAFAAWMLFMALLSPVMLLVSLVLARQ